MAHEIVLGSGEHRVHEGVFTTNLVLAWHKARLVLTNKRLTGYAPNTLLGLIPLGGNEISQPLDRIARVHVSTKFRVFRVILGAIALIVGLGFLGESSGVATGLVLILIGALWVTTAWLAVLAVYDNSGNSSEIAVSGTQKNQLKQFAQRVNIQLTED